MRAAIVARVRRRHAKVRAFVPDAQVMRVAQVHLERLIVRVARVEQTSILGCMPGRFAGSLVAVFRREGKQGATLASVATYAVVVRPGSAGGEQLG